MLTTAQLTDAITQPQTAMSRGQLTFLHQQASGHGRGGLATAEASHAALLEDLLSQPVQETTETYQHPAARAVVRSPHARSGDGALTASEIAWLGRLDRDPAKVPFADAQRLAQLTIDVDSLKHPIDHRLLENVWSPVRDWHDRNSAQVDLRNAQGLPVSPVPASATLAYARSIAAENPGLTDSEALGRAGSAVRDAADRRGQHKQARVQQAQDTITRLDKTIAAAASPTAA